MAEEKQTSLKPLTIYFYHTRLTRESYEEWKEYKFPGHILYGPSIAGKTRDTFRHAQVPVLLKPPEAHALRNERNSVLQGEISGALRHFFPWYRTGDFPPCTGAIPQADRYLAPHGSSQQFRFRTRTNIPPFL